MKITKEDILDTGNLELLAKKAVEGFITGIHKSPFHGFSVEFAEHRQYYQGESTKNIDWKLYGRTDKLYNKIFNEETNLRCQFLIDVSSSMQMTSKDGFSKLQHAIWSTAVLTQILKKQRDASGICFFDNEIKEYTKIGSSGRHYKELIYKLNSYLKYKSAAETTDISSILHTIAAQIHKRSMIILFTDFLEKGRELEPIFEAIKHLKHNKHEVIVFQTIHRTSELDFDYENRPMTFEDLETGAEIKLLPSEVKDAYVAKMKKFNVALKSKLNQYKIEYSLVDTSGDIKNTILPFLLKRKSMTK